MDESDELEAMRRRVHQDTCIFDHDGIAIPCIVLPAERFDRLVRQVAGKPVSIDTNLNILHDGLGHVFVEISLSFPSGTEMVMVSANDSLEFFEALAASAMIAISPGGQGADMGKVFAIQLPRRDKAHNALDMIKSHLGSMDGAVAGI